MDALSRRVVEFAAAEFESFASQNSTNELVEPRGFEPLIRQWKTTDIRRSLFYELLATIDVDGLGETL
jgi:hypothetical protein